MPDRYGVNVSGFRDAAPPLLADVPTFLSGQRDAVVDLEKTADPAWWGDSSGEMVAEGCGKAVEDTVHAVGGFSAWPRMIAGLALETAHRADEVEELNTRDAQNFGNRAGGAR